MRKKQSIPSAFEDAFEGLGLSNTMGSSETTNMDTQDTFVDVEPNIATTEPTDKPVEVKEPENTEDPNKDTSDIPDEVLNRMNDNSSTTIEEDNKSTEDITEPSAEDLTEAQQVGAFFDAVAESFGWNTADIEDNKPVTVEQFTDYMRDVINENSVPEYADERIQALDAYVKNGGRFEDFYAAQQQQMNYDNLDIENEDVQRTVIRELLKTNGYTDSQINNKLERYESADMLEEEAEDALSRLKVIKQQETERLQQEQEAARRQAEEQNRQFFNDVNTQITNLTNIRGISIPKEDRKALFDYIFKVDADGVSQYQKDFNKNLSKNLIESAYFTMKADQFVTEAKKTGETTAAQKLRQMLRHTSKNHSSYNANEDKQRSAWEIASKFL